MPYLGGSGGEWVAPPLGDQPVEVKKAQLYQLNLTMLADPVQGYNQEIDGFPPPLVKCTTMSKACAWRLSFGIYGDAEATWKARHDGDVQVSWAGTFKVTGMPYSAERDKFYITWERYVAPVLGGMADGAFREFVKSMAVDPAPDLFARMFKGMRCMVHLSASPGTDVTFYNVTYDGPAPRISSDPAQADHNLTLLKDRLRLEQAAVDPRRAEVSQVAATVSQNTNVQILGVFTALKSAGLKNDAALKADVWQTSNTRAEFIDELTESEAQLLLIAYTALWEEFEKSGQTAAEQVASSTIGTPKAASVGTKQELERLFQEVTVGKHLSIDDALEHVRQALGDNAEQRKEAAGGFYMNALTEEEARQIIQDYHDVLNDDIPF